jgi:hypothetical protein
MDASPLKSKTVLLLDCLSPDIEWGCWHEANHARFFLSQNQMDVNAVLCAANAKCVIPDPGRHDAFPAQTTYNCQVLVGLLVGHPSNVVKI